MTPVEKFKNTIELKYGTIIADGPNGEHYEARSYREMEQMTGVHRNTIQYAVEHSGRTRGGWNFERRFASE